jgi:argininosuccinate lyase
MPLWSGRFESAPDAALLAFGASFGFDRRLLQDDVAGSLAWAGALARAGVLSTADAARLQDALKALLDRARRDPAWLSDPAHLDEDVHSFVERHLVESLGDLGRRLHTGRSRNEQVSLDFRLYLRRRLPVVQHAVAELVAVLADQASAAGDAVMPAYTHLRRAQPILVAHFLLAHVAALQRDHHRLGVAREEADGMPLGSGAVAGTNYAIDTSALAAELGFSRVVANSVDATSDRDFVAAFLHAAALLAIHLSRLAEDLILLSGEEFGFFELADEAATGSSLMPQKKNPDPLELVRGKAGRVIGRQAGWLATMKGLPSGYNKDLQEDKEAVFDAEDTVLLCTRASARVVASMRLNRERAAGAAEGLLLATEVADYLVEQGVPFRTAHEVVGAVVRALAADGRDFRSLTIEEWRAHDARFGPEIIGRLDAARAVASKKTPQSTAPGAVAAALAGAREWLISRRT